MGDEFGSYFVVIPQIACVALDAFGDIAGSVEKLGVLAVRATWAQGWAWASMG